MRAARFIRGGIAAVLLAGLAGGPAFSQAPSDGNPGAHDRFRWPLRGAILRGFKSGANDGIDIAAPVGEPVHAAADGVCIYAGDELQTYGKLVLIRHADGFVTAYADNSELEVKEGDPVKRGQIIAKSGNSGEAASPRLHFELRKDGKPVDPIKYLAPL
jgi:murein DD-endopeptidase MepM/ murein hydrolase activator NlpD